MTDDERAKLIVQLHMDKDHESAARAIQQADRDEALHAATVAAAANHKDLAPGNVMLFGDAKQLVLYFDGGYHANSDFDKVDPKNLNRLLRNFSDPARPAHIVPFAFFTSKRNRESFIGDLEERYWAMLQQEGYRAANRWYRRQVTLSFLSFAFAALKRVSGLEKLIERYRRIGS